MPHAVLALLVVSLCVTAALRFAPLSNIVSRGRRLASRLTSTGAPRQRVTFLALTDSEYNEIVEDIMYSGDLEGIIRRKAKDLVSEDFAEYLVEKLDEMNSPDLADERSVVQDILNNIRLKLRLTDGLGADSEVVYERRLDRIIFTPPKERRSFIASIKDDLTPGFVEFIQREMANTPDQDSKVVLASVLQMIGQSTDTDFLGGNSNLLQLADESLGDEFAKASPLAGFSPEQLGDQNEQILAGLLFSRNDIVEDVLNNLHIIDEDFISFLQKKADSAQDLEERAAMTSLLSTINVVVEKLREVEQANGFDGDVMDEEVTMDQIKQRMQEIQSGQSIDGNGKTTGKKVQEFTVKESKQETFATILSRFQNLPEDTDLRDVVRENYDLCDYEFIEMLRHEAAVCENEGAHLEAQTYLNIIAAINSAMAERMGSAQSRLERILSKRDPQLMEAEVVAMTRRNEVDEALMLLMEANAQQARVAGATQAADLLDKLKRRVLLERERRLPEEQKLLRQLMRIESSEDRKGLLFQAFKASKSMTEEGELVDGPPLVTPPVFINMVRTFILNFGNVDGYNLLGRAQSIVDEAQIVATDLYGEGMTARDQQRFMFDKNTVSVWDLANFEEQAMMSGEEVPWKNPAFDGKEPEEVLGERVRRIGGDQAM